MNRKNNKVWALTGSIATGKSTVSKYFSDNYSIKIINADDIGHFILSQKETIEKIGLAFGAEVIEKGCVDRGKLGKIVFGDKNKLETLNSIIHPELIKKALSEIEKASLLSPVIFEAAILIEAGWHKYFDKIILTTCDKDIQLKRVMERNKLSLQEATNRIASQMVFKEKKLCADYIVDTTSGLVSCLKTLKEIGSEITS